MIVMIEELGNTAITGPDADPWVREQLHVRRAWVHHHELVNLLGWASQLNPDWPSHPDTWTFMGMPLRIADTKKWNELLLLEGSKRVTALDWPPSMQMEAGQTATSYIPTTRRPFTKYVA